MFVEEGLKRNPDNKGWVMGHPLTADDEKGEVIAAVLDERGYITAEKGEVKRQTLYGKVTITRQ
ncbi:hypothetical protein ACSFCW_09375 [Yokenella regensburgei]|uniref:hypothetical protein n=1 Tax=Yokenella regensburgei TaxID=158877 RepID=UPI003EDA5ECF